MQVPRRKAGRYTNLKPDPHLTQAKVDELRCELEKLKASHAPAAAELRRLAEMGDLSENAAHSLAKGRLRHLNQRIAELEDQLKHAVVITKSAGAAVVQLGSRVTVQDGDKQITYTLLGSEETNPARGVISHHSPLGAALMGSRVGDTVAFSRAGKTVQLKVEAIA
jgi:transcription elongation GreA/GreB family factor